MADDLTTIKGCWADRERMGGTLCIKGRRIPISMLLADLAECDAAQHFATRYDLKEEQVRDAIDGVALYFQNRRTVDTAESE